MVENASKVESGAPPMRFEVRTSAISGRGVYALDHFQPNEAIAQYIGERVSQEECARRCAAGNRFLFSLDDNWALDGADPNNAARYFNHSCSPNCRSHIGDGEIWIVARREIQPGEELTFDYGYQMIEDTVIPCHCGAPNCYRFIVAEELRWYPPGTGSGTTANPQKVDPQP